MAEAPKDRYCVTIKPDYAGLYPSLVVGTPYPVNNMHPRYGDGFWLERTPDPVTWVRASVEHVIPVGPSFAEQLAEALKAPKLPPRRERRKRLRGK